MPDPVTRRKFLTSASLGVAAAAGIAAAGGASALGGIARASAPAAPSRRDPEPDLSAVGDDVVAHVRNASTGEVVIYVGTREVVYRDRALVSRLLAGARTAGSEA
ncbi:MAG: hypothetical protein ACYDAK_03005 [Candidatus Limnocylindrales bacterium]